MSANNNAFPNSAGAHREELFPVTQVELPDGAPFDERARPREGYQTEEAGTRDAELPPAVLRQVVVLAALVRTAVRLILGHHRAFGATSHHPICTCGATPLNRGWVRATGPSSRRFGQSVRETGGAMTECVRTGGSCDQTGLQMSGRGRVFTLVALHW